MTGSAKTENVKLGIAVIIATVFAMAFADAVVKYVSSDLPLWQIFVVRSIIAIPLLTLIFSFKPEVSLRAEYIGWTLVRSFLLAFMYIAIYAAAPIISLSVIAASLYTSPLFITIFAALLLGEKIGQWRWLAIFLGFGGVLFIIRPDTSEFHPAMLVPIMAAVFYAIAAILTRSKCADEHPLVLALNLNYALIITGLVLTFLFALVEPFGANAKAAYPFLLGDWIPLQTKELLVLGFLAVLIVVIGIGLAVAYQSAPAAVIATFDYSYLIFAVFWGYVFFADKPNFTTALGMVLILLSGLLVTFPDRFQRILRQREEAT